MTHSTVTCKWMRCSLLLVVLASAALGAPSSAVALTDYILARYYGDRAMATGVAAEVYTYPQTVGSTGLSVSSIYARVSTSDYIEVAWETARLGDMPIYSGLSVYWEREGFTNTQQGVSCGPSSLWEWYTLQIYSYPNGSRFWKAGRNNTVFKELWTNFSTAKAEAACERQNSFSDTVDSMNSSHHKMQFREYLTAWGPWAGTTWIDHSAGYGYVRRSASSWYSSSVLP